MTCRPVCILALLVTTIGPARASNAQSSDCTYDRCALRLQASLFSNHIVQGAAATPVGRLGLFAPRIEPLVTARDSARIHYDAFRTYQNRGGALEVVALVAGLASAIVYLSSDDFLTTGEPTGAASGLFAVGVALEIAGGINKRLGRDRLHRAMWFYNRSLVAVR
jgi:hypothetical protein